MFSLATLYYRGVGVKKNLIEASHWYKKAANQGHCKAKKIIYRLTLELLTQSAEQENSEAMYELARQYLSGNISEKNYNQAQHWLTKAVNLGHIKAMVNLANLYDQGLATPQDTKQAISWFEKAAKLKNDKAMVK